MAETPVEVVIRARNESQAALNQAVGQLKQLEAQTKATGATGVQLGRFRDAIAAISPAASGAVAQVQALAASSGALGPLTIAASAAALGIVGIGLAAFKAAKSLGDMVESLDNMARVTGASVGDLQVLNELFERQGIGADAARQGLHRLNIAIAEGNPTLKALGITAKDPIEALFQLSDVLGASSNTAAKAKVAQELLGRGGRDLLAAMVGLRGAFAELNKEMTTTGQKMGQELLEQGRRADDFFEKLGGRLQGLGNSFKGIAAGVGEILLLRFDIATGGTAAKAAVVPWQNLTLGVHEYESAQAEANRRIEEALAANNKASAAVQAHAAAVKELVDLFGMERAAAELAINGQERLAKARRKAALETELFAAKAIPGIEVRGTPRPQMGAPGFQFPFAGGGLGEFAPGPREGALDEWRQFLDNVTSSARVANDAVQALASGLTSGLSRVFQGLLEQGQTFRSAMVSIFRSMVDEILAQLARLLALSIVRAIITAATGVPVPGSTMGSPRFVYPHTAGPAGPGLAGGGNTTVYISTIDSKSYADQMRSRLGVINVVTDRLALAGET